MPYIPFTEEQILKAASVDLPAFLRKQGVELEKSGHEFRLAGDPYITVRNSNWFDQAEQRGGNAISLVRNMFGCNFPQAVTMLLEGEAGQPSALYREPKEKEQKPFALPPRHTDQRRVYAYLIKQRQIPADIVTHFVKAKTLYESAEPSKDGQSVYHNAVFVGYDEQGQPRHAHKHGLNTFGASYKGNIGGSNPSHSFSHVGTSNHAFAFEAPIDLLSYITIHPNDWQQHSYVALCGVSEYALRHLISANPAIKDVTLCLDNDERGLRAAQRLMRMLQSMDGISAHVSLPNHKDWNIDLQVACKIWPDFSESQVQGAEQSAQEGQAMCVT